MFESSLQTKLKTIFGLKKATFDLPSDHQEQECIFIQVDQAKNSIKNGTAVARVSGKIRVFGNADKLPFGFFSKKIAQANPADTASLFFHDIEENAGQFVNICERSMSFVYFYSEQYDPNQGEMTSINITEVNE